MAEALETELTSATGHDALRYSMDVRRRVNHMDFTLTGTHALPAGDVSSGWASD